MLWPTIWKQGEVRVPWGKSASGGCFPGSALSFGRSSAPPIHQFPCCLALSLLRAFGLSPNVGWLSKAVPVLSHPPIPSSKSKLQATLKTKKGKKTDIFIPQNMVTFRIGSTLQFVLNYFYCSMHQWTLKDICNEILYRCIQLDKCHRCNRDCCRKDPVRKKMDCVL